jgi:putative ABC transport system permease protein
MRITTHFRITIRSLQRIKQKVYFTIVFLAIGIASLYSLVFLGQAAGQETARRFYSQGYDLFSIIKKRDSGRIGPNQLRKIDYGIVDFLKHSPRHVTAVAPELVVSQHIVFGENDIEVPVIGVLEDYLSVHALELSAGRFFTKFDSSKAYCILGSQLAARLFARNPDALVGERLYINEYLVENIGILKKSSSFVSDFSIDEAVLVPLRSLQQFLANPEITKVTIRANPNASVLSVVHYLEKNLQIYLGDVSNYEVNNQSLFLQEISKQQQNHSLIIGGLGIIFLLAGSWAFYRLICILILRRRNEVAFIQDYQMKDKILLFQFFLESMMPVLIAGILGVLMGILLSYYIAVMKDWMFFVSNLAIAISLGVALFIGLLMGWYPSIFSMYSKKLRFKLKGTEIE